MASFLESAAEAWFKDMMDSEHSFERPLFFVGMGGRSGVNVVTDGTVQRTPGRIQVLPMGLSGFVEPGDSAWYRIKVNNVMCAVQSKLVLESAAAVGGVCCRVLQHDGIPSPTSNEQICHKCSLSAMSALRRT
jgi:hypothetical protein